MERIVKKGIITMLSVILCCAFTACGGDGGVKIDATKTQLYVHVYDGGYGDEWLEQAAARFEEMYKDVDSIEEGKKGVQIVIDADKSAVTTSAGIKSGVNEIYFADSTYYNQVQDALLDITDVVTVVNPYDNKTILSKFYEPQAKYYGGNGDSAAYYAIPYYFGTHGIVYNKDLFDEIGAYIGADGQVLRKSGVAANKPKSVGPDNIAGNDDDGLPRTYDEFFAICEYLKSTGKVPIIWSGKWMDNYTQGALHAVSVQAGGRVDAQAEFSIDGAQAEIVTNTAALTADENGFVTNAQTQKTPITSENFKETKRMVSKLHALTFMDKLISNYTYTKNTSHSHTDAQYDFITSGTKASKINQIGMLLDGPWWESEATSNFNQLTDRLGQEFAKKNRHFAWMPLPRPNNYYDHIGDGSEVKNTLYCGTFANAFVKSTIAQFKVDLAKDFLRYIYQDEELIRFTEQTGATYALKYDVPPERLTQLSAYAQSFVNYAKNADMVFCMGNSDYMYNQMAAILPHASYASTVNGKSYSVPVVAFRDTSVTGLEYFKAMNSK